MRFTGFLLLLLLAGLAGSGVYYYVIAAEAKPSASSSAELLFPDFGSAANRVAEIQLHSAKETLNAKLVDDAWTLEESGGYPVKLEVIKKLALSVAELRIEEAKTAKPEQHERLGLNAPEVADSTSKRLSFRDADGALLASLIIGNSKFRSGSQGTFVRRAGEDQSWLCAGRVELPYASKAWLDSIIISLKPERVSSLRIQHADGAELNIERSSEDPSQYDLVNVPLGRKLASEGNATSAATALSNLSFDAVQRVEGVDFSTDPSLQSTYRCEDGLVLNFIGASKDEETWFKISARYEAPASEQEAASGDEEDAHADEDSHDHSSTPDIEAEATELNQRLAPWAFKLPGFKADLIGKPMEELLESLTSSDANSTPDFALGPDGKLPPELQKLLNKSPSGPPIPRQTPVLDAQIEDFIEEPVLMDEENVNTPAVDVDGDDGGQTKP